MLAKAILFVLCACGGDTGKDQRVYYFNTKEIMGNKYGTATPIPFKVVINEQMGLKLSVDIRCNGEYTYKLTNPLLFLNTSATSVVGNLKRVLHLRNSVPNVAIHLTMVTLFDN